VICPTTQGCRPATEWHDGQFSRSCYAEDAAAAAGRGNEHTEVEMWPRFRSLKQPVILALCGTIGSTAMADPIEPHKVPTRPFARSLRAIRTRRRLRPSMIPRSTPLKCSHPQRECHRRSAPRSVTIVTSATALSSRTPTLFARSRSGLTPAQASRSIGISLRARARRRNLCRRSSRQLSWSYLTSRSAMAGRGAEAMLKRPRSSWRR
jgi:hypothetical protein